MIKSLLAISIIICCQILVFGQPRKPRKPKITPPPPPIYRQIEKEPTAKNDVEKVLKTNSPKAFAWKLETAGKVLPETFYREYVGLELINDFDGFSVEAKIQSQFTIDSVELKKDEDIEKNAVRYKVSYKYFSVKVEKDVLTMMDKETKNVEKFKVFFDKNRKNILKLQNLKNQAIYLPAEVEYPVPMIVAPK